MLSDDAIDAIVGQIESITSPFSQIGIWAVGGAVSRVDSAATAVGEREVGFEVNVVAAWPPSDPDSQRHIIWVREGWNAFSHIASGSTPTLTLFNGDFINRQARHFAERLRREAGDDPVKQVDLAYRLALARPAKASEIAAMASF